MCLTQPQQPQQQQPQQPQPQQNREAESQDWEMCVGLMSHSSPDVPFLALGASLQPPAPTVVSRLVLPRDWCCPEERSVHASGRLSVSKTLTDLNGFSVPSGLVERQSDGAEPG